MLYLLTTFCLGLLTNHKTQIPVACHLMSVCVVTRVNTLFILSSQPLGVPTPWKPLRESVQKDPRSPSKVPNPWEFPTPGNLLQVPNPWELENETWMGCKAKAQTKQNINMKPGV